MNNQMNSDTERSRRYKCYNRLAFNREKIDESCLAFWRGPFYYSKVESPLRLLIVYKKNITSEVGDVIIEKYETDLVNLTIEHFPVEKGKKSVEEVENVEEDRMNENLEEDLLEAEATKTFHQKKRHMSLMYQFKAIMKPFMSLPLESLMQVIPEAPIAGSMPNVIYDHEIKILTDERAMKNGL